MPIISKSIKVFRWSSRLNALSLLACIAATAVERSVQVQTIDLILTANGSVKWNHQVTLAVSYK